MTMLALKTFLGGNWLIVGLMSALCVTVLGWDSSRKAKWVESGKETVRVETRKANDAAVKTSTSVRAKSQSSSMRGTRDPYTSD